MIIKLIAFVFVVGYITMLVVESSHEKKSIQTTQAAPKETPAQTEIERKKQEEICEKDRQCRLEKYSFAAKSACQVVVEKLPKYEYEWVDGLMDQKFSEVRWSDFDAGIILVAGDKIKFQNGFGAYLNHRYGCEINVSTGEFLDVFAEPGRFN